MKIWGTALAAHGKYMCICCTLHNVIWYAKVRRHSVPIRNVHHQKQVHQKCPCEPTGFYM